MAVSDVLTGVQPAEEVALNPAGAVSSGAWLEAMFREHYSRIVNMLARLTGDRGQAEEISSDVFCKLAQRRSLLGFRENRTAWLYRVAANAGMDGLRRNLRRRRREREAGVEVMRVSEPSGALDDMLRAERCSRVREVLAGMKPREAQLVLLRAEGLAYRQVAQTLGIQPGSVGTLLARAEREFERRFRQRYGDRV